MKGFPGGSVVKNLPANAEDTGSIPAPRRFPHDMEQPSMGATITEFVPWGLYSETTEPTCPRAGALQEEKRPQSEARAPQLETSSCLLQVEKSPCSNEDPARPTLKSISKFLKLFTICLFKKNWMKIFSEPN